MAISHLDGHVGVEVRAVHGLDRHLCLRQARHQHSAATRSASCPICRVNLRAEDAAEGGEELVQHGHIGLRRQIGHVEGHTASCAAML